MAFPAIVFQPSVALLTTMFVPVVPKVRPALPPVKVLILMPLLLPVTTLPEPMTAAAADTLVRLERSMAWLFRQRVGGQGQVLAARDDDPRRAVGGA